MSVVHHGSILDTLSNAAGSVTNDGESNRLSVVSCLVPASVAVAARWERIYHIGKKIKYGMSVCTCTSMFTIIACRH